MSQQAQEQVQALAVQALWLQTVIVALMGAGVVLSGLGEALKTTIGAEKK